MFILVLENVILLSTAVFVIKSINTYFFLKYTRKLVYWFTTFPFWDARERTKLMLIETVEAIPIFYLIFIYKFG
jgi:hypothetical protein